jgi:hypothetical protein
MSPQQRRLAGAVRSDQPDRLAPAGGEADPAHRVDLAHARHGLAQDHAAERGRRAAPSRLASDLVDQVDVVDDDGRLGQRGRHGTPLFGYQ